MECETSGNMAKGKPTRYQAYTEKGELGPQASLCRACFLFHYMD